MEHPPLPEPSTATTPADLESAARRDALQRLGRYASYVPPVVLTLLVSQRASAASPVGGGDPPGGGTGPGF